MENHATRTAFDAEVKIMIEGPNAASVLQTAGSS